jgi:branched-chain amino acid transport system ATP-binding protein
LLELVDVHTYYGESYICQGVSLEVKDRTVVALLGRNGMGKTTAIRSIIGLVAPRSGMVRFKGKDIAGLEPYKIARMGIGLIPQGRLIFPSLSVEENLTMAARSSGKPEGWSLNRMYSLFPILKDRAKLRGTLLSGGEQQMLSISRALMTNPDLLLMDEPSEGLAPMIVTEISRVISQLRGSGFSILLVEQNLRMALALADYTYVMSKGTVVYESKPEELKKNEEVMNTYIGISK